MAAALLTRATLARPKKEGAWRRRGIKMAVVVATLVGFAGAARASAVASPAAGMSNLAVFLRSSFAKLNELLLPGASRDLLEFLFATALFVPMVRKLKASPIIGFLLMGVVLGPSGLNWFSQVHLTHQLAEFGIIFFLFEMGLELSVEKVLAMKFDVFVLGAAQFLLTGATVAWLAQRLDPSLLPGSLLVLGGALALSSSAFVLQLIRDKGQLGTRYGRAAFGVLLFQDLAVVPLLVVIPLLAGGGDIGLQAALGQAAGRGGLALGMIFLFGHFLLNPLFGFVSRAQSPEAFLAITLGIVILCSAVTEGLGLSNTLGAFLSGVVLSETQYRHQVEADIAPFRGMLLGLFFTTVGFSINIGLIMESWRTIVPLIVGLIGVKTGIVCLSCGAARLPGSACVQTALLLAPGGEFAFVMLGLAERLQLLSIHSTQLLVTSTALSMALTPVLSTLGEAIATSARTQIGFRSYEGKDSEGTQIVEQAAVADPFIVVCGFGRIGKIVCQLLNAEGAHDYIAFDNDPEKAIQARSSGLPVFLADCTQPETMNKFRVGKARLVVVAIGDKEAANQVASAIAHHLPEVKMLVRAADDEHEQHLLKEFGLDAVVPTVPPESIVLAPLFAGEVLKRLGYGQQEVDSLLEVNRRDMFRAGQQEEPCEDRCLKDVFRRYDEDCNGEIDVEEMKAMLVDLGQEVSEAELNQIYKDAGLDQEGTITLDKFKGVVTALGLFKTR